MIAPKVGAKFGIQHACGVFRGCLGLVADPPPVTIGETAVAVVVDVCC